MIREIRVICVLEQLGVALDHAHRRADLVGQTGDQRAHRGELLGSPGARLGVAQLGRLALVVARQAPPLAGELLGQVLELEVVPRDVSLHGDLCVEEEELLQRHHGSLRLFRVVRVLAADHRNEQREIEGVRPEIPARLETDPIVGLADAAALRVELRADVRPGEAQLVAALLSQQTILDGRTRGLSIAGTAGAP